MIFIAAANGGTISPLSEGNVNNLSILTIVMQNCPALPREGGAGRSPRCPFKGLRPLESF